MVVKLQNECDLNDESERFIWALRGIEYNGFPFLAPEEVFREWSRHLSRCGFVHINQVREAETIDDLPSQEIHYQPPVRGDVHDLNGAGKWVPIYEPIQPPIVPMVEQMTPAEREQMINDLRGGGYID